MVGGVHGRRMVRWGLEPLLHDQSNQPPRAAGSGARGGGWWAAKPRAVTAT